MTFTDNRQTQSDATHETLNIPIKYGSNWLIV